MSKRLDSVLQDIENFIELCRDNLESSKEESTKTLQRDIRYWRNVQERQSKMEDSNV